MVFFFSDSTYLELTLFMLIDFGCYLLLEKANIHSPSLLIIFSRKLLSNEKVLKKMQLIVEKNKNKYNHTEHIADPHVTFVTSAVLV